MLKSEVGCKNQDYKSDYDPIPFDPLNNFNFEKFIPSFGSEILDALYRETPIIESTFEDFLKLPTIEGYKKNPESKIDEIKTEIQSKLIICSLRKQILKQDHKMSKI